MKQKRDLITICKYCGKPIKNKTRHLIYYCRNSSCKTLYHQARREESLQAINPEIYIKKMLNREKIKYSSLKKIYNMKSDLDNYFVKRLCLKDGDFIEIIVCKLSKKNEL